MDDVYEKLSIQVLQGNWIDLGFHRDRGSVFLIPSSTDIVLIGHAIATDQTRVIEAWLASGFLQPVRDKNKYEKEALLRMLIVQPFVLIQELNDSEEDIK